MPSLPATVRHTLTLAFTLSLSAVLLASPAHAGTATPEPAPAAKEQPAVIGFIALGQKNGYFEATVKPGETVSFTASVENESTEAETLRTYPADGYSLVNGGFGAKDKEQKPTGATDWVRYPNELLVLAGKTSQLRSLSVTVPKETTPGEYITSVVMENETAAGAKTDAMKQVVRRTIPIAITVPGTLKPAFSFGDASHHYAQGKSVVGVAVNNTGNAILKPAGTMTVLDASGKTVSSPKLEMRSVFSGTTTSAEVQLASALLPGDYFLNVEFRDEKTGVASKGERIPFTVGKNEGASKSSQDNPAAVFQDAAGNWWVLALGAVIIALLAIVIVLLVRRRKTEPTES